LFDRRGFWIRSKQPIGHFRCWGGSHRSHEIKGLRYVAVQSAIVLVKIQEVDEVQKLLQCKAVPCGYHGGKTKGENISR
jgi:hypothetical protein